MKVLFLYVSTNMCRDGDLWYYDEGVASAASCLRRAGHGVAFRLVGERDDPEAVLRWVLRKREDRTVLVLVTSLLFSAYGHDFPGTLSHVARLREETGLPVVFAGLHATLNPEQALAHPGVDAVGRGEMDEALVEFCGALDAGREVRGIRNFWVKDGAGIQRNELRPLVQDLSTLPFPARDLLDREQMANERDGILTVVAMRGCPMDCNFCSNPVLQRLYAGKGRYTRLKPVGYLLREILAAREGDPGIRAVFFHDDIFGLSRAWMGEFLDRYPREVGLPYGCNLMVSQADEGFARRLRRSGCRQVQIGVESGSAHLRNAVVNKGITDEEIARAVRVFREAGILVKFYAMMGLPEETRRRFRASVRSLARFRPDMIQIQVWEPHSGSDLLERDPGAGGGAGPPARPAGLRSARRIRFLFRRFHGLVALYEALDARNSLRAALLGRLLDLALLLPWTPERLLESRALRRWGERLLGRLARDVRDRETRLASVCLWPEDLGPPPRREGWVGSCRIDGRGAGAEGSPQPREDHAWAPTSS